jgi:TP901 family phage tail tape measure protein
MSALRELLVAFDVDTGAAVQKLKGLDGAIGGAKATLGTLATSILGAFSLHAATDFIKEQIEIGSKINDTAEKLGVGTDELQQFQYAAGLVGVSAEGAGKALGFLNKNMGNAIDGNKESVETFKKLGIEIKDGQGNVRELGDVLPDLANSFADMGSQQERTAMAMKIFGKSGAELLPLLSKGSEELAEMKREFEELGGGMQSDFIDMADKAGDEIDRFKFAMQGLKSRIAVEVLPTVIDFAKQLQKGVVWIIHLTKETNIVKDALALFGVVGSVAAAKAALGWAKFFGVFPKGNAGIAKTLAQLGTVGLIIAAVAALALVFEDLWVGINGGDSAIRGWLNAANGVEETDKFFAQLKETTDNISKAFDEMKPQIGELTTSLGKMAMSPEFIAALEFCVRLLGAAVAESVGFVRAIGKVTKGDLVGAGDVLLEGDSAALGKKGFLGSDAWGPTKPGAAPGEQPFVGPSYLNPASPDYQGGAGAAPTINVNGAQTIINVNGAGDSKAVADEVSKNQRNQFADEKQNAVAALKKGK